MREREKGIKVKNMVRREMLIGGRRKKNGDGKDRVYMGGMQRKVRRSAITNRYILREERSKQNLRRYTT